MMKCDTPLTFDIYIYFCFYFVLFIFVCTFTNLTPERRNCIHNPNAFAYINVFALTNTITNISLKYCHHWYWIYQSVLSIDHWSSKTDVAANTLSNSTSARYAITSYFSVSSLSVFSSIVMFKSAVPILFSSPAHILWDKKYI